MVQASSLSSSPGARARERPGAPPRRRASLDPSTLRKNHDVWGLGLSSISSSPGARAQSCAAVLVSARAAAPRWIRRRSRRRRASRLTEAPPSGRSSRCDVWAGLPRRPWGDEKVPMPLFPGPLVVKLTSRGIGIYISAEALRNCTQPPSPSSAACAPASLRGLGGSLLPLDPRPSPLSPVSPFSLTSLLSLPPPSRRACRFGGARSNLIPCPMILSLWIVIVPGAVPGSRAESGRAGAPCFPAPS